MIQCESCSGAVPLPSTGIRKWFTKTPREPLGLSYSMGGKVFPSLVNSGLPCYPVILHSSFKWGIGIITKKGKLNPLAVVHAHVVASTPRAPVRFRLNNLAPAPGANKKRKRKGRGNASGQGNSCGAGMKGQKARRHPGIRRHFEGGQNPLSKRIPKLKGQGNRKGVQKFIAVNLRNIDAAGFREGEEVSLETLKAKRVVKVRPKHRRLPLKILGIGDVSLKYDVKARSFSASARRKLEAAGCAITQLAGPTIWMRPSVLRKRARSAAYFARKKAEKEALAAASGEQQPQEPPA